MTDLEYATIHECGHAVAAIVQGIPVWGVFCAPNGVPMVPGGHAAATLIDTEAGGPFEHAVIALAGIAATRIAGYSGGFTNQHNPGDDVEIAEGNMALLEPSERRLVGRTVFDLLRAHWGAVEALAALLAEKHELDAEQIGSVVHADIAHTDSARTTVYPILAQSQLRSVYEYEVRADEPVAWWRLGNPADSEIAADWAGTRNLTYTDNPRGGEALVSRDPQKSTLFTHPDAGSGNVAEGSVSTPITAYPFTIEAVFRSSKQTDDTHRTLLQIAGNNDGGGLATRAIDLYLSDSFAGEITYQVTDDQYATSSAIGSFNVRGDDNKVHHVVVSATASDDVSIWLDGVLTIPAGVFVAGVDLPTGTVQVALGNIASNFAFAGEYGLDGELQDVAIYDGILSDERIAVHADAALHAWQGDSPSDRLNRVLDIVGWPSDMRSIDAGNVTFQSADTAGKGALEHCQKVSETEFGLLFVARDGNVRLVDRAGVFSRVSQGVFGDDPSSGEIGYRGISFTDGDETLRNRATVSRLTGAAKVSVSPTSVDEFGPFDYTLDGLLHDSDSYSQNYADAVVAEYQLPRRRVTSLTLGPAAPDKAATLYPQMLGRELGDVVTINLHPPGSAGAYEGGYAGGYGGSVFSQDCVIDGITHSGSPGGAGRTTTWALSPMVSEEF